MDFVELERSLPTWLIRNPRWFKGVSEQRRDFIPIHPIIVPPEDKSEFLQVGVFL